ncbi:MAG: hypothetical protein HY819_23030 [Acidobacteria bacterium]|nr:hypothetical protein [Acidobacteriota bacterium]
MGNIINDLKKIIFASKIGPCPSVSEWQSYYKEASSDLPIKHLTSCSNCLDIVNQLHSLPMLKERNPFDSIERDGGDSSSGNSTPFNSSNNKAASEIDASLVLRKLEENRQKHFEYLPQEVTLCVNGWPFTSCRVQAGANYFTLRPKLDDMFESLELLDERGILLCHILLSEIDESKKQNLEISSNQMVSFSIIWLDDYPEINLEYIDKRFTKKEIKENSLFTSFSNFMLELQSFFSPKKLIFASALVALFVIGLVTLQIFWQKKFDKLEQQLARTNQEKQSVQERLIKAESINQTLEKDLARSQEQAQQKPSNTTTVLPNIELPKVELVSKIKMALAIASQKAITNLIYNTRAVISPILLERGSQSVFGVRLPKYEENSQQEFTAYIVKVNLAKEKPFIQQIKLPANSLNSADPAFVSIEIKIYNTNNLPANTLADAVIIGVVGNQEVKIDTIPLKFE